MFFWGLGITISLTYYLAKWLERRGSAEEDVGPDSDEGE